MSGQGTLQVPLVMETPNDAEASPGWEWPKNAKEPRPKKRKRVPARPIRPQCKKKMKYAAPEPYNMFQNTKPKLPKNSSSNKTSRKKLIRFWQPPPPLFNPYSLDYRPKSPQEPHDLFQKHYEYQRFKKEKEKDTQSRYGTNFSTIKTLNDGSYGTVFMCRDRITGLVYAVKKVKKKIQGHSDLEESFHEVFVLSVLDKCPYINRFYCAWVETTLYIQLEYCAGGSVYQSFCKNIKDKDYPFTQSVLVRLLRHISIAVAYMHERNIAHLDLKPQNIFIRGDKTDLLSVDFIVGDLGNARQIDKGGEEGFNLELGDGTYLAPELLATNDLSEVDLIKVDVWGMGVTLYELMSKKRYNPEKDAKHPTCADYDSDLNNLVKKMVNRHPVGRPGVFKILHHHLVRNDKTKNDEIQIVKDKYHECQMALKTKTKEIETRNKEIEKKNKQIENLQAAISKLQKQI